MRKTVVLNVGLERTDQSRLQREVMCLCKFHQFVMVGLGVVRKEGLPLQMQAREVKLLVPLLDEPGVKVPSSRHPSSKQWEWRVWCLCMSHLVLWIC